MKKFFYIFPTLFMVTVLYTPLFAAGDMTMEYEGIEYVLRENNSWDFVDQNSPDVVDPIFITLHDNRIILISPDYSWRFVDKAELKKSNDNISVKMVTGKGKASHLVLSEATAMAKKKALTNATSKLKSSIKHRKLNYNKLLDCVRRVEKEEDSSESFTKGKGWSVSVQITLDKGSILAVLDCEGKKAEKKDTTKTAPKK